MNSSLCSVISGLGICGIPRHILVRRRKSLGMHRDFGLGVVKAMPWYMNSQREDLLRNDVR